MPNHLDFSIQLWERVSVNSYKTSVALADILFLVLITQGHDLDSTLPFTSLILSFIHVVAMSLTSVLIIWFYFFDEMYSKTSK